jgi:hypothetical protein
MNSKVIGLVAVTALGCVSYFVATQEARDAIKRYEQHYVCSDRSLNYYLSNEITNWHFEQRNRLGDAIARGQYFGMPDNALQKVHEANSKRKSQIEYIRKDAVEEFQCMPLWQSRDR